MSLNTVCRVCLAMDVPMHIIADNPLQSTYEKLTGISLNIARWPMVVCYICHAQLRKCHNLMVRSVRAYRVLSLIHLGNEMVKEDSITMLNQEAYQHALFITPVELISITGTENSLVKMEIEEETLLSQCNEGIETDRSVSEEYSTFEESDDENDSKSGLLEDVDNECQRLINTEDIKQEELDPLNISSPVEYIEAKEMTDGDDTKSEGAENMKIEDSEGASPTEKCKQTQVENMQDGSTLALDGLQNNILKTQITLRTVSEEDATIRNVYDLSDTQTVANNRQISINNFMFPNTKINKSNVSVDSDNDCAGTNTDVDNDNTSSKDLRRMFTCNDCGNAFADKYLLIEHIQHHIAVKKTNYRKVVHQTVLRKQRFRTVVLNKHTETHGRNNLFECDICQRRFALKYLWKKHLFIHTGLRPFECEICDAKFNQKSHLKKHLEVHSKKTPYECEICKLRFSFKRAFKAHLRIHVKKKSYECEICKATFSGKRILKKHSSVHRKEKCYECEICKVKFTLKKKLKMHLRSHVPKKKPFKCDICNTRFINETFLNTHLIIHTKEKPLECEICKARFRQQGTLKRHLNIHTKEKFYECDVCNGRFSERGSIIRHLRIHTKEKPYECEICLVRFNQESSLNRHSKIHTNEKPYKCEICNVSFREKYCLTIHLRNHAKEKPFQCEICKRAFVEKRTLNRHLKAHAKRKPKVRVIRKRILKAPKRHTKRNDKEKLYECQICNTKFAHSGTLTSHLRVHTKERPYECEICNFKFTQKSSLNTHLRTHTKERPYECEVCKAKFRRKDTLDTHCKRFHTKKI